MLRRLRPPTRRDAPDAGFTLVEMLVAMGIFSVLLVVLMAAVTQWFGVSARDARAADLSSQSQSVFGTFDDAILSAVAINRPIKVGSDWYVEALDQTVLPNRCAQWVMRANGTLQYRYWDVPASGKITSPAWSTKGSHFVVPGSSPFTMTPAGTGHADKETLTVTLDSQDGPKSPVVHTEGSFVARNSSSNSVTNQDSSPADGVSDTQVCLSNFSDVPGGRA